MVQQTIWGKHVCPLHISQYQSLKLQLLCRERESYELHVMDVYQCLKTISQYWSKHQHSLIVFEILGLHLDRPFQYVANNLYPKCSTKVLEGQWSTILSDRPILYKAIILFFHLRRRCLIRLKWKCSTKKTILEGLHKIWS